VRPDGLPLATSAQAFLVGQIFLTPSLHADGTSLATGTATWAGAPTIGDTGSPASTCEDWSLSSSSYAAVPYGIPAWVYAYWFGGSTGNCAQALPVYCFEP